MATLTSETTGLDLTSEDTGQALTSEAVTPEPSPAGSINISLRAPKGYGDSRLAAVFYDATVGAVGSATLLTENTVTSDAYESWYYAAAVAPPAGADFYAIVDSLTGEVFGSADVPTATSGGISGLVLPVMQGKVYTATTLQQRIVTVVQGDTPVVTFDLGADYTGWVPWFGIAPAGHTTNAPRQAAWLDATRGQGSITLTTSETGTVGAFGAEVELRNSGQILTAIKFTLKIIPEIITN